MKNTICLFEDEEVINLNPLVYLRPVYDLRLGILTLKEKFIKSYPKDNFVLHCRNFLQNVVAERNPHLNVNKFESDTVLFFNGRFIPRNDILKLVQKLKEDHIYKNGNLVVAARLSGNNLLKLIDRLKDYLKFENLTEVPVSEINADLIKYPWDLVNKNGEEIINDYALLCKNQKQPLRKYKSVELINKKNIFINKGVRIDPFVVLDASDGPIYIGKNVRIMSHSTIQGPASIGENSTIKMHAAIYHNTSIGEVCKVGGEIEESIIHSYSNKQHEGFLGHAYIGSWVNIGASTNNSDLKNNYSRVDVYINGKHIDSGSQFFGLIMGDHSKTAINTMLNTGTNIGISCNIFGAGFPPKYIPSFAWGGSDFLRTYNISKSIEVAKIVIERRNVNFSKTEEALLETVYEMTEAERASRNVH